jgi:hypothetical protein
VGQWHATRTEYGMCSECEECVEYRECRTQWYTGHSGSTVQSRFRTLSALVPPSNRSRVMHHDSSSSLLRITDHALPAPNSASGIPHLAATQTCSSTLRHSQPFTSLCPCRLCVLCRCRACMEVLTAERGSPTGRSRQVSLLSAGCCSGTYDEGGRGRWGIVIEVVGTAECFL